MRPSSIRTLRIGAAGAKLGVVGALAALALGLAGPSTDVDHAAISSSDAATITAGEHRVDDLLASGACSRRGYGDAVVPATALVRRHDRIRRVSFDAGWATFQGHRPGTLIAVCR